MSHGHDATQATSCHILTFTDSTPRDASKYITEISYQRYKRSLHNGMFRVTMKYFLADAGMLVACCDDH